MSEEQSVTRVQILGEEYRISGAGVLEHRRGDLRRARPERAGAGEVATLPAEIGVRSRSGSVRRGSATGLSRSNGGSPRREGAGIARVGNLVRVQSSWEAEGAAALLVFGVWLFEPTLLRREPDADLLVEPREGRAKRRGRRPPGKARFNGQNHTTLGVAVPSASLCCARAFPGAARRPPCPRRALIRIPEET
jgi:hypothetical protein